MQYQFLDADRIEDEGLRIAGAGHLRVSPAFGQGLMVLAAKELVRITPEVIEAYKLAVRNAQIAEEELPDPEGPRQWGVPKVRVQKEVIRLSGLWVYVTGLDLDAARAALDALGATEADLESQIIDRIFPALPAEDAPTDAPLPAV